MSNLAGVATLTTPRTPRALIVGRNNPRPDADPLLALAPDESDPTGARVYRLIAETWHTFTREQYRRAFTGRHLWPHPEWPVGAGSSLRLRDAGWLIMRDILHGPKRRTIVLLGPTVWKHVLETRRTPPWCATESHYGCRFVYLPHPSTDGLLYGNAALHRTAPLHPSSPR